MQEANQNLGYYVHRITRLVIDAVFFATASDTPSALATRTDRVFSKINQAKVQAQP